jgi:uncharacterized protein YcbK (DUF882 family)
MKRILVALLIMIVPFVAAEAAVPTSRYTHTGDGTLNISSGRGAFNGRYRKADGGYETAAMQRINAILSGRLGDPLSGISPRFIEFLDFLQDTLSPNARITIRSGYRSPAYNTNLREQGKLAAKASMHQYGMAADLSIAGIASDRVWEYVKELGFGGAGFYHGNLVHVDVGPARSWDETSSGVGTDISEENKLVAILTDKDRYLPGETLELRFIRMTAFPFSVPETLILEELGANDAVKNTIMFLPAFTRTASTGPCRALGDIRESSGIRWELPAGLAPGRYRVRVSFCDKQFEAMPAEIVTLPFEVRAR